MEMCLMRLCCAVYVSPKGIQKEERKQDIYELSTKYV